LERLERGQYSSLFCYFIIDEEKKFYYIDTRAIDFSHFKDFNPGTQVKKKTFISVSVAAAEKARVFVLYVFR
jgi:hypothetical protein